MFARAHCDSSGASLTCLKASPHDENTVNTFQKKISVGCRLWFETDVILFLTFLIRLV